MQPESVILGNFIAEKKAYLNSHFILGMISHKNKKKSSNVSAGNKNDLSKTNTTTPANVKTPARTKHVTPKKTPQRTPSKSHTPA